jgi:hypothetical protein
MRIIIQLAEQAEMWLYLPSQQLDTETSLFESIVIALKTEWIIAHHNHRTAKRRSSNL